MSRLDFRLEKVAKNSKARAARFRTLHNEVLTPLFMPVGTHGSVRSQRFETLLSSGSQILLANTYHLLLRPGAEVFRKFGGLHNFMKWPKSVLTDSGGFQIFAMPNDRRMSEEGAKFLSYVDGKHILLTPELSIETQKAIGSDIMMVLDQCVPSTVEHKEAKAAMELSNRWALRSMAARGESPQSIFAIVQGACYPDLRKASAEFLSEHPFDGFALGGLAVGESKQEREDTVEFAAQLLPVDRPRYLMGVGTPIDLLEAVHRGMDMFDCIIPTAHAEQGVAYTWKGKILLRRGAYKDVDLPIDSNCGCNTCQVHSRAYLHQLIKAQEPMAMQFIAEHNIYFYHELMRTMRARILDDTFDSFYAQTRLDLVASDESYPIDRPKRKPEKSRELGDYEIHENTAGFFSVRHKSSGEIMHSVIPPLEEAKALYVQQSKFIERAKDSEIVIWDVGMGAGANVMAAIQAYEEEKRRGSALAPLKIFSFENDLDSLRLASRFTDLFKYLRHGAPIGILEKGEWARDSIEWKLLGDLSEMEKALAPHVIFFDPFSHKTNRDLWSVQYLSKLFALARGEACEIFTYSSSTAVRASFLASGFYVARGESTGPKGETTIALTEKALPLRSSQLLGQEWLEKWERSDAKLPIGLEENFDLEIIRRHQQFLR